GARYDQDRTGYGGQEYGLEGGSSHRRYGGGYEAREGRRPDRGAASGDLAFSARNRGRPEHEAPQDYAYHPREGHEFDPDYLAWREAQMRNHDRDYREWRQGQQQAYDE